MKIFRKILHNIYSNSTDVPVVIPCKFHLWTHYSMTNIISTLKVYVKNAINSQPIQGARIYWVKIPDKVKNRSVYCNKYSNSEPCLQIDVTGYAGFSLLWGKLSTGTKVWIYVHKVECTGFKETIVKRKFSINSSSTREFTVNLSPDEL
ncbi:hypothetical protein ACFL4V_02545 [Candidatus Latescibacterota bacterium]